MERVQASERTFSQENPLTHARERALTDMDDDEAQDMEEGIEAFAEGEMERQSGVEMQELDPELGTNEASAKHLQNDGNFTEPVQKNLQTLIELVFTYLQVYAVSEPRGWPTFAPYPR